MSARRCSLCGINFPTTLSTCHGCGEELDLITDVNPDSTEEIERALFTPNKTDTRDPVNWRFEKFYEGGLDVKRSLVLAYSDCDLHYYQDTLIARGCPPEVAFHIMRPIL